MYGYSQSEENENVLEKYGRDITNDVKQGKIKNITFYRM